MSEQEWLDNTDPCAMFAWLIEDCWKESRLVHEAFQGRKLFLLACAMARMVGPEKNGKMWFRTLKVMEAASEKGQWPTYFSHWLSNHSVRHACYDGISRLLPGKKREVCDLLRDFAGNPWRPYVWRCPTCRMTNRAKSWVYWWHCLNCHRVNPCMHGGHLLPLAEAAYLERTRDGTMDTELLQMLADALEDSGCVTMDLLEYLRLPGRHYRGCLAIDILSKMG